MKPIFLLIFTLAFYHAAHAQNEPLQPFESLGKTVKVLTLSNGKYNEKPHPSPPQRRGSN